MQIIDHMGGDDVRVLSVDSGPTKTRRHRLYVSQVEQSIVLLYLLQ